MQQADPRNDATVAAPPARDERPRAPEVPAAPDDVVAGWTVARWISLDPTAAWRVTRLLTTWIWDVVYRLRTYGADDVPAAGGFLLVPNHSSLWDQFFQGRGQRRHVRFMTKSTLFRFPLLAWYLRRIGAFPIRRTAGDSGALDVARAMLRGGQPVVVYPEGTRIRRTVALGEPRSGAARMALETGVPIVPVATFGAKPAATYGRSRLSWPKVTTVFGAPMHVTGDPLNRADVERVRDEIWVEVTRLYDIAASIHARRPRRDWAVPPRPVD